MDWYTDGGDLVIPYYLVPRGPIRFERRRPDKPRLDKRGRPVKYEQPRGVKNPGPYFPRSSWDRLQDPTRPLVITEGEKSIERVSQCGYCGVGVPGVGMAHDTEVPTRKKRQRDEDEYKLHPAIVDNVLIKDRVCVVVVDHDDSIEKRVSTLKKGERIARMLRAEGARSVRVVMPPGRDGEKVGIDDLPTEWDVHRTIGFWSRWMVPIWKNSEMPWEALGIRKRERFPRNTKRNLKGAPKHGAPTIDPKTPVALRGRVTYLALPDDVIRLSKDKLSWGEKTLLAIYAWNPRLGQVETARRMGCEERWVRELTGRLRRKGWISFRPRSNRPVVKQELLDKIDKLKRGKGRRDAHLVCLPWHVVGRVRDEPAWLYAVIVTMTGDTSDVYASHRELAKALGMPYRPGSTDEMMRRRVRVIEAANLIVRRGQGQWSADRQEPRLPDHSWALAGRRLFPSRTLTRRSY